MPHMHVRDEATSTKVRMVFDVSANTSIARLELIRHGQVAAILAKNVCLALKQLSIVSVTVWMDSIVTLFWISNAAKP